MAKQLVIFIALCLLFLAACDGNSGNNSYDGGINQAYGDLTQGWAVEHNGERHHRAELEYFVFLSAHAMMIDAFQQTGQPVDLFEPGQFDQSIHVVEMALDHYLRTLDLLAFAKYHEITLSPHIHEARRVNAENFLRENFEIFGINQQLSVERVIELDSGQFLFDEIFEVLHHNAFVDVEEFDILFEEMWATDRWEFVDIRISYFFAPTILQINEFMGQVNTINTFHERLSYHTDSDIANETERGIDFWEFINRYRMHEVFDAIEDVRAIANLNTGDVSHIINLPDGFAVLYIESLIENDKDEVRQEKWEQFEANAQWNYVWDAFTAFGDTIDYSLNPVTVNNINVRRIIGWH